MKVKGVTRLHIEWMMNAVARLENFIAKNGGTVGSLIEENLSLSLVNMKRALNGSLEQYKETTGNEYIP